MIGTDLTPFFDTATFAQAATITDGSTVIATVNVILDFDTDPLGLGDDSVEGEVPMVLCPSAGVANVRYGMTLTLESGEAYSIISRQKSGIDMTMLRLKSNV